MKKDRPDTLLVISGYGISSDDLKYAVQVEKIDRQAMIEASIEHVKQFNYSTITKTFVDYLEACDL